MPESAALHPLSQGNQMRTIDLTVRYFQDSPPEGRPYREELFIRRETTMSLPVGQTALVLVDVWKITS